MQRKVKGAERCRQRSKGTEKEIKNEEAVKPSLKKKQPRRQHCTKEGRKDGGKLPGRISKHWKNHSRKEETQTTHFDMQGQ